MEEKPLSYIQNRLTLKRVPVNVNFEVTNRCNYKCIHCARDQKIEDELDLSEIKDILNQLKELSTFELAITGGEPLLRDDIFEILEEADKLNFVITFFTNAFLIDETVAQRLSHIRLKCVDISVYSLNQETYEQITSIKGSFKRMMTAIERLKENGIPVRLKTVVMKSNVKDIPSIYEFARENEFKISYDEILFATDSSSKYPFELMVNDAQVEELEHFRCKTTAPRSILIEEEEDNMEKRVMCAMGTSTMTITANGDVLPCITARYVVGNTRKNSLKEIWNNSKELNEIRAFKDEQFKKCCKCPVLDICRVCPGINLTNTGSFFKPAFQKCRLAKIKRKLEDFYETEKKV